MEAFGGTKALEVDERVDDDGDVAIRMRIDAGLALDYFSKEEAITLIEHLQKVFEIKWG